MNRRETLRTLIKLQNIARYAASALEALLTITPKIKITLDADVPIVADLYAIAREQKWQRHVSGSSDSVWRTWNNQHIEIQIVKPHPSQRVKVTG